MSATILPECPNCSTEAKSVKLSKGAGTLECPHCDHSQDFREINGSVIAEGHNECDVVPTSFLWMQSYTEPPEESLNTMIQEYFPEVPYANSSKVAKYRLVFDWKMEIYYD